MHNHSDNNQGHDSKMMWLMMVPCLLIPIIFLVVAGKGFGSIIGNSQWLFPVVAMIGIHLIMMKFMHGNHAEESVREDEKKITEENK